MNNPFVKTSTDAFVSYSEPVTLTFSRKYKEVTHNTSDTLLIVVVIIFLFLLVASLRGSKTAGSSLLDFSSSSLPMTIAMLLQNTLLSCERSDG